MVLMIINERQRWLVITPPKTGSTTLWHLLASPEFGGHRVGHDPHDATIPEGCEGHRVFMSVRDPFARAASLYRMQMTAESFSGYVERALLGRQVSRLQWATLCDWHRGHVTPIRLENLASDLGQLGPSGPHEIPHENRGPDPWAVAYEREPDAWPLVARWARPDCDRFDYRLRSIG